MIRYILVLPVLALLKGSCFSTGDLRDDKSTHTAEIATDTTMETPLTANHLVQDIVRHRAFKGFGNLLLPLDNNAVYHNTRISNISSTMPYHSAVHPEEIVNAANHLIEEVKNGKTVFYNFYNEEQKNRILRKKTPACFFIAAIRVLPLPLSAPAEVFLT